MRIAYNLVRNFQIDTELTKKRSPGCSRTNVLKFNSLKTLRLEWLNVAGRLVNTDGRKTLKLNQCAPREEIYTVISDALEILRHAS